MTPVLVVLVTLAFVAVGVVLDAPHRRAGRLVPAFDRRSGRRDQVGWLSDGNPSPAPGRSTPRRPGSRWAAVGWTTGSGAVTTAGVAGPAVLLAAGVGIVVPAAGAAAVGLLASGPAAGAALGLLVAVLLRRGRSTLEGRTAEVQRRGAVEACAVVADELRAGRSAAQALRAAAGVAGPFGVTLRRAASTAVLGGDVAGVLDGEVAAAVAPTARRLATCWRVAERTGAGLAVAADTLAAALRAGEEQRRQVQAELAGPRATARLLAVLPIAGLLLGTGTGARPLEVLLDTTVGGVCLVVGTALDLAGLLWTDRILARAARGDP